ncbi:hypothetical protein [Natronorubrum texcoconense]|uniref:Uncharacterized protein n=1 Tax=Natronorubrum texcoconense TaxID=1095776 RepID=A0A1G9H736_9EURY|nr:hypothetical protein [Natronorubrum texcoconense]SDL08702.1 hypothetical protein SAMN04515672_0128 [Natronorubrum texcoconense]
MTRRKHTSSNSDRSISDHLRRAVPTPTRTQAIAITFAFLMLASIAFVPMLGGFDDGTAQADEFHSQQLTADSQPQLATTTTDDSDDDSAYFDNFGDGTAPNWDTDQDEVSVEEGGFYNDYMLAVDSGLSEGVLWEGGPTLDSSSNFEITGTYLSDSGGGSETTRLGLRDDDEDLQVNLVQDHGDDATYLRNIDDNDAVDEVKIADESFDNTWVDFRYESTGGEVRAKVWESGTSEPTEWEGEMDAFEIESEFYLSAGSSGDDRTLNLDQVDAGGHSVSGQFVDQNGEPIPNATIEGVGVNYDALNETVDDFEAEAEELLEEAENVELPEEWQEFEDEFETGDGLFDADEFTADIDGTYPLVNQHDDWGEGNTNIFSSEVGDPRLQLDADQDVIISLWALEDNNILLPQGPVSNSHTGGITEGEVVLEEYSAGSVMEKETIETESEFVVERALRSDQEVPAIRKDLSPGVYAVYPEGQPEKRYTFTVGDAEDQWNALESDLRDEAGELTDHAQQIRDNLDSGVFERRTTTTDENGEFDLRMQSGVERATVQAYRADGQQLTDITGPSFDDLRDVRDQGYNGTFVVGTPQRTDVPEEDVQLQGFRTDELPHMGIDALEEWRQWAEEQRMDERLDEIRSEYDKRFDEMERGTLEATYEGHKGIIEINPRAEERYLERSDFDEIQDADDLDNDELAEETGHMQTAITGIETIGAPDLDDPLEIDGGELLAEYPIPGGIDEDTLSPEIHWSDGTSEEIADEYWSIESSGTFGTSNTLVIDGFPLEDDDPAAFDIRIMGGGEDSILDDRISGTNPAFQGVVPDVRSVDLNTMSPGDSDRVSMTFRPGDGGFEGVEAVEVFDPDGEQLDVDLRDDEERASFETNGEGEHYVRAQIESDTGEAFTKTFSIRALESERSDYPTVRAETGTGDELFAIVGDGLRDAEISVDDDRVGISAIVPSGDTPSRLDVKADPAMDRHTNTIDIRVLEGSDERTIDTSVETVLHFDSLDEDAAIWRGGTAWFRGEPMEVGETSRYGEVIERDNGKVVIRTFTEGDGSLEMYVNSDPSWDEGLKHSVATSVPSINFYFLPFTAVGGAIGSLGVTLGMFGIVVRRRWFA